MARRGAQAVTTALALVAGAGGLAATASAATFPPPKDRIYAGVSDTGHQHDYRQFSERVRRHVPVLQAFEVWGAKLSGAKRRWRRTRTRGMLSLSTAPCYQCPGVISPRRISRGRGDRYLLRLNRSLARWDNPVYLRLFPEMNGHWNAYSAFNADGSSRGPAYATSQFKLAWRRIAIIVRGGTARQIDRKLTRNGLPGLRSGGAPAAGLPRPKVSLLWVPQTHGSPRIHANRPGAYFPGRNFVDWVGADIYGAFPNFAGLKRFYNSRKGFPFVIGEWAPWDVDEPSFTKRLHRFVEKRKRARMIVYYQGFGENNPFMLQRYPRSARTLRRLMAKPRYKRYAPETRPPGDG